MELVEDEHNNSGSNPQNPAFNKPNLITISPQGGRFTVAYKELNQRLLVEEEKQRLMHDERHFDNQSQKKQLINTTTVDMESEAEFEEHK